MMAIRRYTLEQLHILRGSPLVQKPDNLPAIEQWIEYVYLDVDGTREKLRIPHSESQKQQQQRPPRPSNNGDASPMGNFSAGQQRPGLAGTRSGTGSRTGDDVSLGPPRTVFASSRSTTRLSDLQPDPATGEEGEGSRKPGGDRQANRRSGTQDGEGRFSRDSWTTARDKRLANAADENEGDRPRFGRRDRDKEHDGDRRNGFGDRHDPRWARDGGRTNGDRAGGWRGRDKPRQERDWDRSGAPDKEPEWMDDPAPKDDADLGSMSMPKNQEDFEKWKQAQHARNKPVRVEELPLPEASPPQKPAATLTLDSLPTQSFHEWGKRVTSEGTPDSTGTASKTLAPAKTKSSRFMPMFKKDEARDESPMVSPPPQNPNGSAEDKEGFQRILQMLGGTGISQNPTPTQMQPPSQPPPRPQTQPSEPASPQARQVSGGAKPKSRFTGFFDQIPKSPELVQSPPGFSHGEPPPTHRPFVQEPGNVYGARQHEHHNPTMGNTGPAEALPSAGGMRDHRPQSGSLGGVFLEKPPSRGAATPDINIQNLLASQRSQRPQGPDKNSEFLLNLLQTKGSSRPPSQQVAPEPSFPLWLDQLPNSTQPHAPKPGVPPPPGHFEDQLLRNVQGGPPRLPQQPGLNEDMHQRRLSQQRAGSGFMDEQLFLQQQRRNFQDQPPQPGRRVQPNMGPQMQLNPPYQYPPEFLQSQASHSQAPPPGFNPHMPRHPPGIHNAPNIFQAPQAQRDPPQQHQQQQLPHQPPPGFSGPNGPLPPFFAGPPPPGFMQMRSPTGAGRGGGFEGMDGMGPRR